VELTYVALRRIKVGGKYRQPGDLVPEASGWGNVSAYVANGSIAPVPVGSAVPLESVGDGEGSVPSLSDLTINDIKARVEAGSLSVEDAYLLETSEEGQNRKTLVSWLEDQDESEDEDAEETAEPVEE
jgi:hypothetical protein